LLTRGELNSLPRDEHTLLFRRTYIGPNRGSSPLGYYFIHRAVGGHLHSCIDEQKAKNINERIKYVSTVI
jgi:hypothetical protein